jgi:copper chaperone CopZ
MLAIFRVPVIFKRNNTRSRSMNYYFHEVPGRLRFKTPVLKGNHSLAKKIEDFLSGISGIESVKTSTVTGSIIVHYDLKIINSREITDIVAEQGYFDKKKAVTSDQYLNHSFEKVGQAVGKAVFGAMLEKAFEGSALSLIAALL